MKDFDSIYPERDLFISVFIEDANNDGYHIVPRLTKNNIDNILFRGEGFFVFFWQPQKYSNIVYALSESEFIEACIKTGMKPVKIRDVFQEFNRLNGDKWKDFEGFTNWIKDKGGYFDDHRG